MNSRATPMARFTETDRREKSTEVNITQILRTLWQGKLWLLLCITIAVFLGAYRAFFSAVPIYSAGAVVVLESRKEQVVSLDSVVTGLSGDQVTINTEVEVIRSRELLEKLVLELNLLEDPEYNRYLPSHDRKISVRQILIYPVVKLKELLEEDDGADEREPAAREILDDVIDVVANSLSVSNLRQSFVFRISAISESPTKAALVANTLAELYIKDQLEVKFNATEQATVWLTDRVGQLQAELEKAEANVKEFNAGTELISAETLIGLNRQLKELRDRLQGLRQTRAATQARLDALVAAGQQQDTAQMAQLAGDRSLTRLLDMMQGDDADDRAAFDARFEQIIDRQRLELDRTESQVSALQTSIEEQEAQINRQSVDLLTLQQLQREAEASRLIYEYFLGRLKETSIQQGIQQADSRILSRAVIPLRPSSPRKTLILAISIVLGFIAGAAILLGRELLQNTYRAAEELESRTGYTVLGQIPMIPARKRKNVLQYLTDKPTSAAAESIRNLRTSVLMSNLDNPPQVIMSTSSIPGEGKTTQSIALAQNLSGLGKKVLLIEGDLRRRIFAEYFDIKNQKGLLSVLSGEAELEEAAVFNEQLNADILVAQKSTTNAADVFSSEKFKLFLKHLREHYEYIIIDTPPVLAVPDARVIGQQVDAIVYTVKWDSTSRRQVDEGLKAFESVDVQVTGLVLSQINAKGMRRYGYGDSYGAYSEYYDT